MHVTLSGLITHLISGNGSPVSSKQGGEPCLNESGADRCEGEGGWRKEKYLFFLLPPVKGAFGVGGYSSLKIRAPFSPLAKSSHLATIKLGLCTPMALFLHSAQNTYVKQACFEVAYFAALQVNISLEVPGTVHLM